MSLSKYPMFILSFCLSLSANAVPVEINKANADVIADSLKGIGQKKAEAIVAYRSEHGNFATPDDLTKVKGIGKKTIKKIRHDIIIGKMVKAVTKTVTEKVTTKSNKKEKTYGVVKGKAAAKSAKTDIQKTTKTSDK